MQWQDACITSKYKIAVRNYKNTVIYRHLNGKVIIYDSLNPTKIIVPEYLEGFTDWEPLE